MTITTAKTKLLIYKALADDGEGVVGVVGVVLGVVVWLFSQLVTVL